MQCGHRLNFSDRLLVPLHLERPPVAINDAAWLQDGRRLHFATELPFADRISLRRPIMVRSIDRHGGAATMDLAIGVWKLSRDSSVADTFRRTNLGQLS